MKVLHLDLFGTSTHIVVNVCFDSDVSCVPSGSSPYPELRGPSVPSSPSCTPSTPTMLCSGNSEPDLNTPLNINLNSSINANYHTAFSSSTGLSKWSNLIPCLLYIYYLSLLLSSPRDCYCLNNQIILIIPQ